MFFVMLTKGELVNRYFQEKWPWIEGTHGMRLQLLDAMSDEHLAFNPGGENVTLGAVCRESGDVEYSYIQSLKTFKQDWSYHNETSGIETSVAQLRSWYQQMDEEMKALVEGFSDDDRAKTIDRGTGFSVPVDMQLDIYLQAQLIFFGKASIYCKSLGIEMTPTFKEYIG